MNRRIDSVDEIEYTSNTTILSLTFIEGDTSTSIKPTIVDLSISYTEEKPYREALPPLITVSRVTDSDEIKELRSIVPLLVEDTSNKLQFLTFIEGDTSTSIKLSLADLSTNHTKEEALSLSIAVSRAIDSIDKKKEARLIIPLLVEDTSNRV